MKQEKSSQITTNGGNYPLAAALRLVGNDILLAVWGGESPHVGAVAIAEPRPSLKNPDEISATGSVYAVIGHKEDLPAKIMAEKVAARFNRRVVVTMGIHWDNLAPEAIKDIAKSIDQLEKLIFQKIENFL